MVILFIKNNHMENTICYKGFIGSVNYSDKDQKLIGRIEGIEDLIIFDGTSVSEIRSKFIESVNEFIKSCKQSNKPIKKSFSGSFKVHFKPSVYKKALIFASNKGITLNQLIESVIKKKLAAVYE